MNLSKRSWLSMPLFTFLAAPSSVPAQSIPTHIPTIDESINLKSVDTPSISPDGRFVVYQLREANWKDNEFVTQLWIASLSSGKNFQLTQGKKGAGSPEWSPDGKWLAFITARESSAIEPLEDEKKQGKDDKEPDDQADDSSGKPAERQIWLISPDGGEAWPLTNFQSNVGSFHWSKNSKQIAFLANPPESKASKDRKEKYSDYEAFERDYRKDQIWLVDVAAAEKTGLPVKAQKLTSDPSLSIRSFGWSPDSTHIAFSALPVPLFSVGDEEDIYLLNVSAPNAVKKIVALPGPDSQPVFSPDGAQLAFSTALGDPNYFYANNRVGVVDIAVVLSKPATTAADIRDLTAEFDEDVQLIDWGPDGIYIGAEQKTAAHLYRINPKTAEIQRISAPDDYLLQDLSFTRDFKQVALQAEDTTHMSEIYVSTVSPFAPRKVTDMTAQVKNWKLGTVEVISWKSQDGTVIEGVLHKPADYDPKKKYPLLVKIHGGPSGTSQPTLSPDEYAYPVQIFLSKGALVLEPNYRGSAGYGADFRKLNVGNLGVGDMWDVMSGVDSLIAKGLVDTSRMGSMGWSEGGYISAFLTTHTDRFKAISVGAGISDWTTYYANTDITPFTRMYLRATPWDDPEIYAKTSPITTIKQAKTPTLIQQGSNDKRVPVPNSYELYRGLLDQGVPTRLILYSGFGHGINKPKALRALRQANLDWFNLYIWNEPIPKDSPLNGTSDLESAK